ncbi:MAG: hypothetical protein ABSE27_06765 [Acidobacteriaceae bacterium]
MTKQTLPGLKAQMVAQRAPPTVEAEAGRIQPEPEARAEAPSVAVVGQLRVGAGRPVTEASRTGCKT